MSKVDTFLNNVLQQRDAEQGIGGNFCFEVKIKKEGRLIPIIKIDNLTQKAAKNLFDLVDENNHLNTKYLKSQNSILCISYSNKQKELDYNELPNIFTKEIKNG
jgi:hypothetical protein